MLKNFAFSIFVVGLVVSMFFIGKHVDLNQQNLANGVSLHTDKAFPGFNLFNSRRNKIVYLLDMDGNIVNQWNVDMAKDGIHHVELTPDGELYAILQVRKLLKYDWSGKLIWETKVPVHHDLTFNSDGEIVSLALKSAKIKRNNKEFPIYTDSIVRINPSTGEVIKWYPLYDLLKDLPKTEEWIKAERNYAATKKITDIFHLNSIDYVNRDIDGIAKEGEYLIMAREPNSFFTFNLETMERTWLWQIPFVDQPHQPTVLPNNEILMFDNGKHNREFSRVIRINPYSKKITWSFKGKEKFYSNTQGGVQKLSNGNLLITVGNSGHIFEIDQSKQKVWEFINFERNKDNNPHRIYRMTRYPISYFKFDIKK